VEIRGQYFRKDIYYKIIENQQSLAERIVFVSGDISGETKTFFENFDVQFIRPALFIKTNYICHFARSPPRNRGMECRNLDLHLNFYAAFLILLLIFP